MMMTISFPLRETSRRSRMLFFPARPIGFDNPGEAQQFGTYLQPRLLGRIQIDLDLYPVSTVEEIDDSPFAGKRFRLAHRQYTRILERFEDRRHMVLFRGTDEKNMAGPQFSKLPGLFQNQILVAPAGGFFAAKFQDAFEPLDLHLSSINHFGLKFFQFGAERIFAHHSENDRRL